MNPRGSLRRRLRKLPFDIRWIVVIIGGLLLGGFVIFISPQSIVAITAFVVFTTSFTWCSASLFLRKPYPHLAAIFIFLFLTINYLVGFDLLNTILLISFIIGLAKLL